jgi:ubiquinone/menaquinone biosynthesis C-methylase UbiE
MENTTGKGQIPQRHHGGRGPSSFWMHDPDVVFGAIQLVSGETFLDMGCGPGDYSVKAAELVGHTGKVIAVDASPEILSCVHEKIDQQNIKNIRIMNTDITRPTALEDSSIDVCLLSTVLHIFSLKQIGENVLREIRRVLKPGGKMIIIECKKENLPFGPPLAMRLSAEEISAVASKCGFTEKGYVDLGCNYLVRFTK